MKSHLNNTNTNTNSLKIVLTIPIPIPIVLKNPIPIPIVKLLVNSGVVYIAPLRGDLKLSCKQDLLLLVYRYYTATRP